MIYLVEPDRAQRADQLQRKRKRERERKEQRTKQYAELQEQAKSIGYRLTKICLACGREYK